MHSTIGGTGRQVRFSDALRAGTDAAHQQAEQAPFVRDLITGELPREAYAQLVVQLHAVYSALEDAARRTEDPAALPFLDAALERVPALEDDLAFLLGDEWRDVAAVLPATGAYVERLHRVCDGRAPGLVAHHYVRYLGDLSGGQIVGRLVARTYDFPDGAGTSAYRFPAIASPKAYKDRYRAALDDAPWDASTQEWMIEEANHAFALNAAVFADLGALDT